MPLFDSIAGNLLSADVQSAKDRAEALKKMTQEADSQNLKISTEYKEMILQISEEVEKKEKVQVLFSSMKKKFGAVMVASLLVASSGLFGLSNSNTLENIVENLDNSIQQTQLESSKNTSIQKIISENSNPIFYEGEDIYAQIERKGIDVNRNSVVTNDFLIEDAAVNYRRTTQAERFGEEILPEKTIEILPEKTIVDGIDLQRFFEPVDMFSIKTDKEVALLLEGRLNDINTSLKENGGKLILNEDGQINISSILKTNFKNQKDKENILKNLSEYTELLNNPLNAGYNPSSSFNAKEYSGIPVSIDTSKAKNNAEIQLIHWLTFPDLSNATRIALLGKNESNVPEIENARKSIETLTALARGIENKDTSSLSSEQQKAQQLSIITWHMQEIIKTFPEMTLPEMFKIPVSTQSDVPLAEDISIGLQTSDLIQKYGEDVPSFYSEEWMKDNRSFLKFMGEEDGMDKIRIGLEKYDQAVSEYVSGKAFFEPTIRKTAEAMRLLAESGITIETVSAYRDIFESELEKSQCKFLTGEMSSPLNDIAIGRDASKVDILNKKNKFKSLNAHIVKLITKTSLRSLGFEPTEERIRLLCLTVQIETTGVMHDYQQGGAALGATQFEPSTVKDMFGRALLSNKKRLAAMGTILTSMYEQMQGGDFSQILKANVVSNITLNIQLAIAHYGNMSQEILATPEDRAKKYKKVHNTPGGAATEEGARQEENTYSLRLKKDEQIFTNFVSNIPDSFKKQASLSEPKKELKFNAQKM